MEEHSQGRLCVYAHLGILTVTGRPTAADDLDGDLAWLQQWPRREDGRARLAACGARRVQRGTQLNDLRAHVRSRLPGRHIGLQPHDWLLRSSGQCVRDSA